MGKPILIETDHTGPQPIQNGTLEIRRIIPKKTMLEGVPPDTSAACFLPAHTWHGAFYRPERGKWSWDYIVDSDVVDQVLASVSRGVDGKPE